MIAVYVISSIIIVFLLHQLYEYFKNTLTVRKNTNLSELYAKKYQSFIDRALTHSPAPLNPPLESIEAEIVSIDNSAVSDDLSKFVAETYFSQEDIRHKLI